jgi:hypothetical protein
MWLIGKKHLKILKKENKISYYFFETVIFGGFFYLNKLPKTSEKNCIKIKILSIYLFTAF